MDETPLWNKIGKKGPPPKCSRSHTTENRREQREQERAVWQAEQARHIEENCRKMRACFVMGESPLILKALRLPENTLKHILDVYEDNSLDDEAQARQVVQLTRQGIQANISFGRVAS